MAANFPNLPQPTVQNLQEIFNSPEFTEDLVEFGLQNTNNFYVDQVGAVLHFWAALHDLNLQLGYIINGQKPFLVPTPDADKHDKIVVWIHNDNASGNFSSAVSNHFSGLRKR